MIVKITRPKSLLSKLEYDFKELNRQKSTIIYSQGVSVGPDGYPIPEVAYKEMLAQMPKKVRTKNKVFACSLNPDPREYLSDEHLMLIGKEFMERMGYKDQPFIIVRHHDIEREHIHILSTRVRPDGSKISDKYEGKKARRIVDELEVKYGLIISPKNAQRIKLKEKLREEKGLLAEPIRAGKANVLEQVQAVVRRVLPESHFQSIGEFNALLRKYNLKAEITKSEYKGKAYDGIAYIPLDDKGQKAGTPITGSELGRGYGLSAVQNKMRKSKQFVSEKMPHFRQSVQSIMAKRPETIDYFQRELEKVGLRAVIYQNDTGRIYGMTFVEDSSNTAINGSKLGKEFSANAFNSYFYEETQQSKFAETLKDIGVETEEPLISITGNLIPTTSDGRDYEEEAFGRRMKRLYGNKKPKRRRIK